MGTVRRVLVRVDASPAIGFGHVSRCLAIASVLREVGVEAVFAMREGWSSPVPERQGFAVQTLPGASTLELDSDEADRLRALALELEASWILVDHYGASDRWLERVGQGPWRLALLDDEAERAAAAANVVINPNLGVEGAEYEAGLELMGPMYLPMNPAFARARDRGRAKAPWKLKRVLVVLGGSDALGLTRKVVEELLSALQDEVEVKAVVGPAASEAPSLPDSPRVTRVGPLAPDELAREMLSAQAAVATPSTVFWEMAALGLPTLLVRTAGNQVSAPALAALGAAMVVDAGSPIGPAFVGAGGLSEQLVRRRVAKVASALTDGRGAYRVAEHLATVRAGTMAAGCESRSAR